MKIHRSAKKSEGGAARRARPNSGQAHRPAPTFPFGAFLIFLVLTGCGYHTAGPVMLPAGTETISIPVFRNQTFEPILENAVTFAVKQEFLGNGRLTVVNNPQEADLILNGTIVSYGLTPLSFDRTRSVVMEYRVRIRVSVTLEDGRTRKVLWQDPSMETEADYRVQPDTSATRVAQDRAIEQAGRRFAENVLNRVLEGN